MASSRMSWCCTPSGPPTHGTSHAVERTLMPRGGRLRSPDLPLPQRSGPTPGDVHLPRGAASPLTVGDGGGGSLRLIFVSGGGLSGPCVRRLAGTSPKVATITTVEVGGTMGGRSGSRDKFRSPARSVLIPREGG